MKLLAGLGNPGPKYDRTRHNVGFMAVDAIADHFGFGAERARFQSLTREGQIGSEKVMIAKPQTFMNLSGNAVGEITRFFKIDVSDVIVLHDEIDLPGGKVRVKIGGGTAGHNGLKSIDPQIGKGYKRVRIGVGHPGKPGVGGHVLNDFSSKDRDWLDPLIDSIARSADLLITGDDGSFMNKCALAVQDILNPPQIKSDDKSE